MSFKLSCKIPDKVYVAFSGGIDSSFALNFCKSRKSRDVCAVHVNHGTENSAMFQQHCIKACLSLGINFMVFPINGQKPNGLSYEEWWSRERNDIFSKLDAPVVTGHNLNDVAEWWTLRSIQGFTPELMASQSHMNVIRPFLMVTREEILEHCVSGGIEWIEDPTNSDGSNLRGIVRQSLLPEIERFSPLRKILRKKMRRIVSEFSPSRI